MTAFGLVFLTQAIDAFALVPALPFGHEASPLGSWVLATFGIGVVVAGKLAAGAALGVVLARWAPRHAPLLALIGCVGCLSELIVVAGGAV
jgi:hypothetical protein